MYLLLGAIQLLLPIALIGWLAFAPLGSAIGLWVQIAVTGLVLLALAWVGMWLFPPWWTPYLFGVLWIGAIAVALRRNSTVRPTWPTGWAQGIGFAVLLLLGSYATLLAVDAHAGRTPAQTSIIELSSPLSGGPYLVVSGGSTESVNAHVHTLHPTSELMAAYRGQSYALDIVKVDRLGLSARGLRPGNPAAYHIFGEPLHAPCDGVVRATVDRFPDLDVAEKDLVNRAGNQVRLQCGDVVVVMAHLRQGSVAVDAGQAVIRGDRLGAVGNSGASDEPHLHIHAQHPGTAEKPLSGQPLQIMIDGRYLVRNDRFTAP